MISEVITLVLGFAIVGGLGLIKPQWFMNPLLAILNRKLPNKSSKIENHLGIKLIATGLYSLKNNENVPEIEKAIKEIEIQKQVINDKLKLFL